MRALSSSKLTRRGFVIGATMAGSSLLVGCSQKDMLADVLSFGADTPVGAFGQFIKIGTNGAVTLVSKHLEMGQGNHAGHCAVVAGELEKFLVDKNFEHAPANARL